MQWREQGYQLLSGRGIEIGALHEPASLPRHCVVEYCDRISKEEARRLFPEVCHQATPDVHTLIDIDRDGLVRFASESKDFVVLMHVIEHLANPIKALSEIFRVLKPGGNLAIGVPDKRYTFDRDRPLTQWSTLWDKYLRNVTEPEPMDYLDVAKFNHPRLLAFSPRELQPHLVGFLERREHLSVWTHTTFVDFFSTSLHQLKITARPVFQNDSSPNNPEYFAIWQKT